MKRASASVVSMFHVERDGDVGILRLDDGRVNSMSPAWVAAFPAAFREAGREGAAPVVVLGNSRALSAGLDLKVLPTLAPAELVDFTRGFMRAFAELLSHPRPVVVGVHGGAIAGGSVLALAGDARLVTPRSRMAVPEVPVGIPFPGPVLDLVRARLPPPEASEAILRGARREGAACVERGWASALADEDLLRELCVGLARDMGSSSPLAFAMAKRQLNADLVRAFQDFEKSGAEAWAALLSHPDTRAGIARSLERLARR